MELNVSMLQSHIEKNGIPVSINFELDSDTPMFKFRRGKDDDGRREGGIRFYLSFEEISEILEVNKSLWDKDRRNDDYKDLVYDVLAKYIVQMLSNNSNGILFSEITPTKSHKEVGYFRAKN